MLERHVGEIQADRLGVEILQRHLVDRLRLRIGIEVAGRVDVGAGMVAQRQRVRLRREARGARLLNLAVIVPHAHHDRRMRRMGGRSVVKLAAQIDELHVLSLPSVAR